MPKSAAIVGWSHTAFGKAEAPDVESLIAEVAGAALDHAGVAAEDVDAITVGVYNNGFSRQGFEGALVALGSPPLAIRRRSMSRTPAPPGRRPSTRPWISSSAAGAASRWWSARRR